MTNIVLCGGVGTRLWPLSRTHLPKQFARILPGDSLFESTVKRNLPFSKRLLVASNRDQSFLAANQLGKIGIDEWESMIEPEGRNTAPAIALSCMMLERDEVVLVTPSDHLISKPEAYRKAVARAMELAEEGKIVTFGIRPVRPDTGFGYIEASGEKVLSFKEKPDAETAERYLASGNFWWNSGMFCFTAGKFLDELEIHAPEVWRASVEAYRKAETKRPLAPRAKDMHEIPAISVDYAVMEKSDAVAVVPCDIGWSDLGSFDAIYEELKGSEGGNAFSGIDDPILIDSHDNLVINGNRKVALIDVEGLLVIESPDALLIAKRGSSQKVKQVVDRLKELRSELAESFPRVERPWGWYVVLHEEEGCKVRRIEIESGKGLSLHRHQSREEHWTIVKGTATVSVDGVQSILVAGSGFTVPPKATHLLRNTGKEALVIVETQAGDYLGDDDIERL